MKKMNNKLFQDNELVDKLEMGTTYGGNKSDVLYTDSRHGGHYDIALPKLIDIVDTSRAVDKPGLTEGVSEKLEE